MRIKAGSAAYIEINIYDAKQVALTLFDPDTTIQAQIYKPDGTTAVAYASGGMTKISTGDYWLVYQSATTDPTGTWGVSFKIVNGANTVYTETMAAFDLV